MADNNNAPKTVSNPAPVTATATMLDSTTTWLKKNQVVMYFVGFAFVALLLVWHYAHAASNVKAVAEQAAAQAAKEAAAQATAQVVPVAPKTISVSNTSTSADPEWVSNVSSFCQSADKRVSNIESRTYVRSDGVVTTAPKFLWFWQRKSLGQALE
jgi:hypothetical protein